MQKESKRVLIASVSFPPMRSGSCVILYELLRHLPQKEVIAVHGPDESPSTDGPFLEVETSELRVFGNRRLTLSCIRRWPELYIELARRRIRYVARKHQVKRIYAHFPTSCFIVAAWQVAEELGLPLTVYYDILWEETGIHPHLAQKYEKKILERADSRFAITEFAAEYLQKKHGVKIDFLPHVIDLGDLPSGLLPVPDSAGPTVHYAGGIYPKMNQDAIVRLVKAAHVAKCRPLLDLCAPALPVELERLGCKRRYLRREELTAAQSQSTILYLPQAFESQSPMMIRCNCPTKMMEYLRSGRPILVHSPPDSYLACLARREGFALIVDRPDAGDLATAIDRLATDTALQAQLVDRALTFVRTRDGRQWSEKLWEALCR